MPTLLDTALVEDTLSSLPGWSGDATRLWREVHLPPEQDAELRRQVTVDAGAMGHSVGMEPCDGGTRYVLRTDEVGGVSELDVAMASHISDLAHRMSGREPGVDAVRKGDPVVVFRSGESADGDTGEEEAPTIGVPSVTGGTTPRVPLPSDHAGAPEPGPSPEQRG